MDRTLDAPDLPDDYYLNLLDWSSTNVLSVALGNTVYLWDASYSSISELLIADDQEGPVTSVGWAPDGRQIAVGLNNSVVQLWDSASDKKVNKTSLSLPRFSHSKVIMAIPKFDIDIVMDKITVKSFGRSS